MGLDICRFIEVKRNNKWERIKWGAELRTQNINNASHFNNGKSILEWWLQTTNLVNSGIPNDSDSADIYKKWGYKTEWVTIHEMVIASDEFEHKLHNNLKLKSKDQKIDEILKILKNEPIKSNSEEYYPDYPWNDYVIEDEFDDLYACGILKLSCIRKDIDMAKGIVEACIEDGYLISTNDIRIVFVYNN